LIRGGQRLFDHCHEKPRFGGFVLRLLGVTNGHDEESTVMLQVEYDPQGAVEPVGDAVGAVSLRVQGDLERFKGLVELGQAGSRHNLR